MINVVLYAPFEHAVRLLLTGSTTADLVGDKRAFFLGMRSDFHKWEQAKEKLIELERAISETDEEEQKKLRSLKRQLESEISQSPEYTQIETLQKTLYMVHEDNEKYTTQYFLPDVFEFMCIDVESTTTAPPIDIKYVYELQLQVDEPRLRKLLEIVDYRLSSKFNGDFSLTRDSQLLEELKQLKLSKNHGKLDVDSLDFKLRNLNVSEEIAMKLSPKRRQQLVDTLEEIEDRGWDRMAIPDGAFKEFHLSLIEKTGGLIPSSLHWWRKFVDLEIVRGEKHDLYSQKSQ